MPTTSNALDLIRSIEADIGRPIGVLLDLQGPKLRVGTFANGPVKLVEGAPFRLDLDRDKPGDATRAPLPHPEIFAALEPGAELLLDDGRLRLQGGQVGQGLRRDDASSTAACSPTARA